MKTMEVMLVPVLVLVLVLVAPLSLGAPPVVVAVLSPVLNLELRDP